MENIDIQNYNKQEILLIDFLPSLPLTLEEIVTVVAIRCDGLLMKVLWLQGIERFFYFASFILKLSILRYRIKTPFLSSFWHY